MREIVLDTETTGLDPGSGHRLVEIAAIELKNHVPTGERFHSYIDPQRDVPDEAMRVHGLTTEFLAGKPKFAEIAHGFVAFLGDSPLVIHNAEFDLKFLNAEFQRIGLKSLISERAIDTLMLARRKHPGSPASLDALCLRYRIDSSRRKKHSALVDAEILAEVYLELIGGRQSTLILAEEASVAPQHHETPSSPHRHAPLEEKISAAELAAHKSFVETLGPAAVWLRYRRDEESA